MKKEKVIIVKRVKNPIFSIIIPTLNEEKYLEDTLLSLKWQNFKYPYEIIVSDSNSKDRTVEIAKKYANKIIISEKKGVAAGRNTGAKYAEGRYLLFLDADTILLPNALKEMYKEIRKNDVVLVSLPILPSSFDLTIVFYYSFYDIFSKTTIKLKKPQVAGMVMCCKKKDFFRIGGFNEEYVVSEDYEFSSRIRRMGKIRIIDSTLALTSPRRIVVWGKIESTIKYLTVYFAYLLGLKRVVRFLGKMIYKPIR